MTSIASLWIWLGIAACVRSVFRSEPRCVQPEPIAPAARSRRGECRCGALARTPQELQSGAVDDYLGQCQHHRPAHVLSNSVLAGVYAFLFSAIVITLLGEIIPQAYFARNALRMASRFLPFLRFYLFVLYPVTKPTAMLLDWWLGKEGVTYLAERDIRALIGRSAASGGDIGRLEAIGAQNFLDLDNVLVSDEGEELHPQSIISLPLEHQRCVLPKFDPSPENPFLRQVDASGKKWVIITNPDGEPVFVLDSHHFLRDALLGELDTDPSTYWHRPTVVRDMKTRLGEVIGSMRVVPERPGDDVIDHDLILVWSEHKRIITGSDLLGRLLRNIATVEKHTAAVPKNGASLQ